MLTQKIKVPLPFRPKGKLKGPERVKKILEAKQLENCENNGKLGREESGKNNLTPPRAAGLLTNFRNLGGVSLHAFCLHYG